MPASPSDVVARYLQRIAYQGESSATLATLQSLLALHTANLPFENFSPLLGEPVSLQLPALQAKLLDSPRGGWCFEHNTLLCAVLQHLGFDVTPLAARVLWMQSHDARPARSHMLLQVRLPEGLYLADAGFGAVTLSAPLALQTDSVQQTAHGTYHLKREPDGYSVWALLGDDWSVLYQFDLQPQQLADFDVLCWYLCHHPQSRFLHTIAAARLRADGRHTLRDRRYMWRHASGGVTQRDVTDMADLLHLLQHTFGIVLPGSAAANARLLKLLQPV
jgi:N-hydroxyarylamine O-acetyltransferase